MFLTGGSSWKDLLKGWTLVYEQDGVGYWRRPGKDEGISATTNYKGSGLFYPFTTSTVFEANKVTASLPSMRS